MFVLFFGNVVGQVKRHDARIQVIQIVELPCRRSLIEVSGDNNSNFIVLLLQLTLDAYFTLQLMLACCILTVFVMILELGHDERLQLQMHLLQTIAA